MKRYESAGLQIDLQAGGRTQKQAAAYAAPAVGPADLTIACDTEQILKLNPELTDPELAEYLATGSIFARALPRFDGLMLHSSAVIWQERAYLFSAPSGTGKSTHTEKWIRLFGAAYLNDDKPALRLVNGTWMAYGTPWSGKHDLSDPRGVPLGGIAVLQRGTENAIRPLGPAEALPFLMSQTSFKLSARQMDRLLPLVDRLLREVPVWLLTCRNDDEAAYISYSAMTGNERRKL